MKANSTSKFPIRLFEVADTLIKREKTPEDDWDPREGQTSTLNQRRLCALVSDTSGSQLDTIHGLLDQVMIKLRVPNVKWTGYHIAANDGIFNL